jgi:hypothetical protein
MTRWTASAVALLVASFPGLANEKISMLSGEFFPPRWGGANVPTAAVTLRLPFLHLPVMPNRFIARMTVIAFHKSPPRGVGMLRLVNS